MLIQENRSISHWSSHSVAGRVRDLDEATTTLLQLVGKYHLFFFLEGGTLRVQPRPDSEPSGSHSRGWEFNLRKISVLPLFYPSRDDPSFLPLPQRERERERCLGSRIPLIFHLSSFHIRIFPILDQVSSVTPSNKGRYILNVSAGF